MHEVTLRIPAEHAEVMRQTMKGELAADAHEAPRTEDQVDRDSISNLVEKVERHSRFFEQIGWDDSEADGVLEVTMDCAYFEWAIQSSLNTLSDQLATLAGEYHKSQDAVDLDAVHDLAKTLEWLSSQRPAQVLAAA